MGSIVRDIVTILTQNITALKMDRESLEINYDLLLSGSGRELRFVLGKIILNTLGCGIASKKDHGKEEKDDLHALNKTREVPTDLRKGKKESKRSASSIGSEQKQEVAKKQKVMVSSSYLSEGATDNHELVTDKWPKDVAIDEQDNPRMPAEGIGRVFQDYASNMQEKHKIKSVLETVKCKKTQPWKLIEDEEASDEKHCTGTLKLFNVVISKPRKSRDKNLQQQDSSKQSELTIKADKTAPSQPKEPLKKDVNGEHKRSQTTLSSLFR